MKKKPQPDRIDNENPQWTDEHFAQARAAAEVLPEIFGQEMAHRLLRPRGRPRAEFPKQRINIRLSQDVLMHFKSSGSGWQTRIDHALRQFIEGQSSPGR